ncbi:MAG: YbgC/FadM family acyl-CoA thioesterase [Elusimicrobiota bacterium]
MEIKIYYKDTDCGGVVYYANYLKYFEMGRTEWLENKGVSVKQAADNGILFVVKDAHLNYKAPARYQDIILVDTVPDKIGKVSLNFKYRITNRETGKLLVTGSTKLGVINEKMRPVRLPGDLYNKLTT